VVVVVLGLHLATVPVGAAADVETEAVVARCVVAGMEAGDGPEDVQLVVPVVVVVVVVVAVGRACELHPAPSTPPALPALPAPQLTPSNPSFSPPNMVEAFQLLLRARHFSHTPPCHHSSDFTSRHVNIAPGCRVDLDLTNRCFDRFQALGKGKLPSWGCVHLQPCTYGGNLCLCLCLCACRCICACFGRAVQRSYSSDPRVTSTSAHSHSLSPPHLLTLVPCCGVLAVVWRTRVCGCECECGCGWVPAFGLMDSEWVWQTATRSSRMLSESSLCLTRRTK
jgi:hypothetical protein